MEPLTVLILAGGQSSRMGQDKTWLDLDGVPLVEHVARRVLPLASEVIFSANNPAPFAAVMRRLPAPSQVVADERRGAGPLAGLQAGLRASANDLVLALATDMPFVDQRVVIKMMELCAKADAVLPVIQGAEEAEPQVEPLHALYRRSCLPAIEAALANGRRRVVSFLEDVRVCYVDERLLREIDPELRSFRNVNTPADWAAARELFGARKRES